MPDARYQEKDAACDMDSSPLFFGKAQRSPAYPVSQSPFWYIIEDYRTDKDEDEGKK
jgi:hypothetical protein